MLQIFSLYQVSFIAVWFFKIILGFYHVKERKKEIWSQVMQLDSLYFIQMMS